MSVAVERSSREVFVKNVNCGDKIVKGPRRMVTGNLGKS